MSQQSKSSSPDSNRIPGEHLTADERLFKPPTIIERRAFVHTDPWRALRILGEFVEGFDELADVRAAVTFFGSARMPVHDFWYQRTVETARLLGENNFAIITGAGSGVMEAANRGAQEAGTLSIGLNIELPEEQEVNPYVDRTVHFRYMFARKTMLVKYSSAFIFPPGGYGTLDELCEVLTLRQTGKIGAIPIVLMGEQYWDGFVSWLDSTVRAEGKIGPGDLDLFHLTDDPSRVVEIVLDGWRNRSPDV
ncbi:MAG: TIGR00730 family Rossman fold protein [Gemmatimonadota bacterium]|nr:MAG: TIGR00730 family Rossman fold protein [Gemmatimonadota bacterium]